MCNNYDLHLLKICVPHLKKIPLLLHVKEMPKISNKCQKVNCKLRSDLTFIFEISKNFHVDDQKVDLVHCAYKAACSYVQPKILDIKGQRHCSFYRLFFLRLIAQFFTQIYMNCLSVHKLNKLGKFW